MLKKFSIPATICKKSALLLFTVLVVLGAKAQEKENEFITVAIGYGLTAPYDEEDVMGTGYYAQGEYVYEPTSWFGIRPYAGFILTKSDTGNRPQDEAFYKATSSAFLVGGKVRVTAPIPWVAPYVEVGIGASAGSFETITPYTSKKESGLLMHIPFAIGLEIGRKHNFDFGFTYYFHPSVAQFSGAVAFGASFPLHKG